MNKNCLIISHRGSNKIAPQNTIDAFKHSILFHADGFETDIHLSNDGCPVICHNYDVKKTSDGNGIINKLTLEELKSLDFGSYFHPSYKGTRIPTLEEFLKLCSNADLKVINIEIKPPRNGDYTVVDKTISLVKKYSLFNVLLISSFDSEVLIKCKEIDINCKTGLLYSPDKIKSIQLIKHVTEFAKEINVDALHPHKVLINKKFVEEAHENNLLVNPWTVNTKAEIIKMLKCNVDGIITDMPDKVRKIIESVK